MRSMADIPKWATGDGKPTEAAQRVIDQWSGRILDGMGPRDLATAAGCGYHTAQAVIHYVRHSAPVQRPPVELPEIERWDKPQDDGVEDLIEHRSEVYRRKAARKRKERIKRVDMPAGPYAIAHLGDPHVDDDGCDWPSLLRVVRTVSQTPGMYAGNVGDLHNNWVGRLGYLYSQQSTTLDDALKLSRWLIRSMPHVYLVLGNHDKWNTGDIVMRLLLDGADVKVLASSEARVELSSPGCTHPIRIVARHDFKGSSIWNRAHGPMRASKLEQWGDIYVSGHRHVWVTHCEEGWDTRPRWSIVARGFKRFDSYAEEGGFQEHEHGECMTTVIQPGHPHPGERVKVYMDVEEAADVLTYLRQRK